MKEQVHVSVNISVLGKKKKKGNINFFFFFHLWGCVVTVCRFADDNSMKRRKNKRLAYINAAGTFIH